MTRPLFHRRRHDPAAATIHHGSNADCPDVQAGRASRCPTHTAALLVAVVPDESAVEHLRNALAVIRFALDCGEAHAVVVAARRDLRDDARLASVCGRAAQGTLSADPRRHAGANPHAIADRVLAARMKPVAGTARSAARGEPTQTIVLRVEVLRLRPHAHLLLERRRMRPQLRSRSHHG